MRILFISFPYPWPLNHGGRQRRFHLVRELARRHEVTLLTLLPPEDEPALLADCPLNDLCARVITVNARAQLPPERERSRWASIAENTRRLLADPLPRVGQPWQRQALVRLFRSVYGGGAFDAVWVDRHYFGEVARKAGIRRLVVDLDDVECVSLARQLAARPWARGNVFRYAELAKVYCYERQVTRRFRRVAVCKESDRRLLAGFAPRVHVIPNGVPDLARARPEAERPGELLFVGSLDYAPNADAVHWFRSAVLPDLARQAPDCRFHVVGKAPPADVRGLHDGATTVVHGAVRNLDPPYESAAVVLAPIRLGSGTRLKVLEALGRGKAVVATATAVEGLDLRPAIDYEQADEPAAFAAACARLLRDPGARRRLGEAGRRRVYERYHWSAIGRMAERALTPPRLEPAGAPA